MNTSSHLKVEKVVDHRLIRFDISFSMYISVSNSIEKCTVWKVHRMQAPFHNVHVGGSVFLVVPGFKSSTFLGLFVKPPSGDGN